MKAIFVVVIAFLSIIASAQSVFGDATRAFALMPSEAISSGVTSQVSISESGRLILFQRQLILDVSEKPQGAKSWLVYDRGNKTTKRLTIPTTSFVSAMFDDSHLVFSGYLPNEKSGILDLRTGDIRNIDVGTGHIMYAGDKAFAPFIMFGNRTGNVTLMSAEGKSSTVNFGENIAVSFPVAGDSENVYFHSMVVHSSPRVPLRLTMNRATGKVTQRPYKPEEERNDFKMGQAEPLLNLVDIGEFATISVVRGSVQDKSEIPSGARIGPGYGRALLSPTSDFVVYQDAGSLLLREIRSIDLVLAKKLTDADALAKLIDRAKQVGTALAILASDNDDAYPGQEEWETKLQPYVKNKDVLKDFNYTFRGGDAASIADPSRSELGFFVTSGGRVVVFADTSVSFVPDP